MPNVSKSAPLDTGGGAGGREDTGPATTRWGGTMHLGVPNSDTCWPLKILVTCVFPCCQFVYVV
jgi:hypothetical protein